MVRREQFVTTRQFLESARSLDITTIECFYELFDNAFDADATSIPSPHREERQRQPPFLHHRQRARHTCRSHR